MTTNRFWMFTDNNADGLIDAELFPHLRYCIYQEEIGENGTYHLQGYLELKRGVRLSALKKVLPRAHWEVRRGTQSEAIAYCSKLDTRLGGPYIFGEPTGGQGSRTDIAALKKAVDEGKTQAQLWDENFVSMLKYFRGVNEYKRIKATQRNFKTKFFLYYGEPGTGKSKHAMDNYPGAYWKQRSNWWDGYDAAETVVIDDFYGWLPFDELLRITDRYPLLVQSKGGQLNFCAKTVIITSNKLPEQWYKNQSFNFAALYRRIDAVFYFVAGEPSPRVTENWEDFKDSYDKGY